MGTMTDWIQKKDKLGWVSSSSMSFTRREWLSVNGSALCAMIAAALPGCKGRGKRPTVLLCSGWQTVNIGDIAHTPGLIQLMQKHLPDHELLLWPKRKLDRGVDSMLRRYFPTIRIVEGSWDEPEVKNIVGQADFLLHGSGPGVVVADRIKAWYQQTGKPFGVFGVTISSLDNQLRELLENAEFVFTRESMSLRKLHDGGVNQPFTGLAPDATFAMTMRDDSKAAAFMQANKLQPDKFICVVPRLRKTPYYKIYPEEEYTPERIKEIDRLNAAHAERDHAKLREAMVRWIRETDGKVAVVPEMTYQLDIMDELLIDPLPEDVKGHVRSRDTFWLPDEAASLYAQSRAVLSFECHSPIIAVAQGTPAVYLRQPEDTVKGQMWYDLGFDDWVFEIEVSTGEQVADTLMSIHSDKDASIEYLRQGMNNANELHISAMNVVGQKFQSAGS
jgi:polysaccharide pyruvyl transferase WcaK-like protein